MAIGEFLEQYVVASDCVRSSSIGALRRLTETDVLPAALFSDQRIVTLIGFENDQNSDIVTALLQIQITESANLTTTIDMPLADFLELMPTRLVLNGAPPDIGTLTGPPPNQPLVPSFQTRVRTKPADIRRLADAWARGSSPVMKTLAALDHLEDNGINRHKSFKTIHRELATSGRRLNQVERDTLIDILLDAAAATDLWDDWPIDLLGEIDFDDDFDF